MPLKVCTTAPKLGSVEISAVNRRGPGTAGSNARVQRMALSLVGSPAATAVKMLESSARPSNSSSSNRRVADRGRAAWARARFRRRPGEPGPNNANCERNHMVKLLCDGGLHQVGSDNASGAQTERRGGAGPMRGLLGGKDPTGRFSRLSFALGQNSKHVVVACGGVVGEDKCPRVGGRESARREEEAAALAQARAAA